MKHLSSHSRPSLFLTHWRRPLLSAVLAASLALPGPAMAASISVHRAFAKKVLTGSPFAGHFGLPDANEAVKFWLGLAQMMGSPDPLGSAQDPDALRFQARFSSPLAFRAPEIRGFLGLSTEPTPAVLGLDKYDREVIYDGVELAALAATLPDVDQRNMRRYARDAEGERLRLPDGRYIPVDPMILNMGGLDDLSSQAHAHYQLAADHPSDSAEVLQKEPWNFVVAAGWPGPVETYAADMAQIHLDLAILARSWGGQNHPSTGEFLTISWWGAGLHYVQDAAGPLHNVQVGSYALFKLAKLQYWKQALLTLGGYAAALPSFVQIGLGFLHNHHLFAEQWLADQVALLETGKPADLALQQVWDNPAAEDPELMAALRGKIEPFIKGFGEEQPWQEGVGGATILVRALAELGRKDGQAMYDAAIKASSPRLREVGFRLGDDEGLKPDYRGDPTDPEVMAAERELAALHAKSMRRMAHATRIYAQLLKGDARSSLLRLRRYCLNRLEAEDKRRAAFVANPPAQALAEVREPLFAVAPVAGLAGLSVLVLVWRRRRRTA